MKAYSKLYLLVFKNESYLSGNRNGDSYFLVWTYSNDLCRYAVPKCLILVLS